MPSLAGFPIEMRFFGGAVARAIRVVVCCFTLSCDAPPNFEEEIEIARSRVAGIVQRTATTLVRIQTDRGAVTTTPDHSFAKLGAGWTPAARLSVGDRIVSRSATRGARVLGLEMRPVAPTQVFNLTVANTHSYLVGSEGLLVHNADCDRPDRQGAAPGVPRPPQRTPPQRTFNDTRGNHNCTHCALGGLAGFETLTGFAHAYNLDTDGTLNANRVEELMKRLGLKDDNTPPEATFRPERGLNRWPAAERFMKDSSANTFFVMLYAKRSDGSLDGHALLAVRKEDGSITYIDLQQIPPTVYDRLNLQVGAMIVTPTNVNWRNNPTLSDTVRDTGRTPPQRGWPDSPRIPPAP